MVIFSYDRITAFMESRDLSDEQVAKDMEMTRQAVHKIRTGVLVPGVETIVKFCNTYTLKPTYFFPTIRPRPVKEKKSKQLVTTK